MNARMLIATHKPSPVPTDSFYMPVHVGHALNPVDLGYQPDNDGENISVLNPSYCELTALYWAWKNLDCDVVGLSHYRRYFIGSQLGPHGRSILSGAEAQDLMRRYDVVLSKPRNYVVETIESHYQNGHHGEDLPILRAAIGAQSPQFLESFDRIFAGRKLSLYNMFLMRRSEFESYATWLFGILEEVATSIGENDQRSPYQRRTLGYLGERLLNVWSHGRADKLQLGYRQVVNTEGEPKLKKGLELLRRKYSRQSTSGR